MDTEIHRRTTILQSTCPNLKTMTAWSHLIKRPVTTILNAYEPGSHDIENLGKAIRELRWGRGGERKWKYEGVLATIKIDADLEKERDAAEVPRPIIPVNHFGFHDIAFVPFSHHDLPEVYPIRHLVQFASAISEAPDYPKRRMSIENFVTWSQEGRLCTVQMVSHLNAVSKMNYSDHFYCPRPVERAYVGRGTGV